MQAAKPLRRLPLVVLSAGRPDIPPTLPGGLSAAAYERIVREAQNYLARLEPGIPHIIARDSGHYILLQQPELVIRAIRQVVQKATQVPASSTRAGSTSSTALASRAGEALAAPPRAGASSRPQAVVAPASGRRARKRTWARRWRSA